jgi:hypothetical protein
MESEENGHIVGSGRDVTMGKASDPIVTDPNPPLCASVTKVVISAMCKIFHTNQNVKRLHGFYFL